MHTGHLVVAQDAYESMDLNRVVFMPTAQAPLKLQPHRLDGATRLELLELATESDPRFSVSDLELRRGGESFTIDTAREVTEASPNTQFFWIIGADQAGKLSEWRSIDELGAMIEFIVLARPGFQISPLHVPASVKIHRVEIHEFDISSSEIRERILARKPVNFFLSSNVHERIKRDSLYT